MDSGPDDESNSTGSTFVLRVAGLATLQQVPARLSQKSSDAKAKTILSSKSLMRAQRSSYATPQEKLLGLSLEPFANLSPPFRELSPTVFLHHASPCLYIRKMGFWTIPM